MTNPTDSSARPTTHSRGTAVRHSALLLLASVLVLACDDEPMPPDNADACGAVPLPVQGASSAPAVTDVRLEVQPVVIVLHATATDTDGSGNINNVVQSIGVFRDRNCAGAPIVLQDDFVGSGVEESFGNVVARGEDEALFDSIAASTTWPVELDVRDADGNRTTGRVRARVVTD